MLYPRRGGGGGKEGGGSGGGKSGNTGGGSGTIGKSSSFSGLQNGKNAATAYGNGGGAVSHISSGIFAGRTVGGGTRQQVFGTRQFGSGYPGITGLGVAGRGFPFYFWPLAWGGGFGYGAPYLHTDEYGTPDNTSRPGGPMFESTFTSNSQNTTLYVIADNSTVVSLVQSIQANCSSVLSNSTSATPIPYNASDHASPQPEQVVQYYRASSVALLLQGYNDTADLTDAQNQTDTPLPSNIDANMLTCVNETIGVAVPMVNGAVQMNLASRTTMMSLVLVLWCLGVTFRIL